MAAYVYALNTNVRTIDGETLGVAEYRYKEHTTAHDADDLNQKLYNSRCKRRVQYFERNALPTLMIRGLTESADKLYEGADVFICAGSCFDDYKVTTKVGILTKRGNRWTIAYLPNGKKLLEIQKQADAAKAA